MQLPRDGGTVHLQDIDLVCHETGDVFYEITDGDPASARCWTRFEMGRRRGDWQIRTDTRTELRCTRTHFELTATLDAYEGETRVFARNWRTSRYRATVCRGDRQVVRLSTAPRFGRRAGRPYDCNSRTRTRVSSTRQDE